MFALIFFIYLCFIRWADKGNEMQIKIHRKENIYVENKINVSKRKYIRRK